MKLLFQTLAVVFVGIPAGALLAMGYSQVIVFTAQVIDGGIASALPHWKWAATGMIACLLGYLMLVTVDIIGKSPRYQVPRNRLPARLRFEFLEYCLAATSAGLLFNSVIALFSGKPPLAIGMAVGGITLIAGFVFVIRRRKSRVREWQAEISAIKGI